MTRRWSTSARLAARKKNATKTWWSAGFTLVEVLIAVGILVSLSALVFVSISQVFNAREYFETRAERFQVARNAISRMTSEISSAYMAGPDHGGFEIPGQELNQEQMSEEQVAAMYNREPIQFGFIGKDDEMHFSSFAHRRTQFEEVSSHHAEISYFVRSDRDPVTDEIVDQLVRREDVSPDDRLQRGGTIYVMVPEVEEVEFEYWDPGEVSIGTMEEMAEGRWVSDWDTTRREYAGRLPTRVRITVVLPPQRDGDEPEPFVTQVEIGAHEYLEF